MVKELAQIDVAKNRIHIYFRGFMSFEDAKRLQGAYGEAIKKAKPGFTVLTFAEDFKPGDEKVQDIVVTMTRMASDAGCRKVARVVGSSPLGAMQIRRLAGSGVQYASRHFRTQAEAEAYLDSDAD